MTSPNNEVQYGNVPEGDFDLVVMEEDREIVEGSYSIDVLHLCYAIETKEGGEKILLEDVSFSLSESSMVAVMGTSGSGKSTLLDILSNRKKSGLMSGNIYFNKAPRVEAFEKKCAYVIQQDIHLATLTVEESVYYSCCK